MDVSTQVRPRILAGNSFVGHRLALMIRNSLRAALKQAQRMLGRNPAAYRILRTVWRPPERVFQHLHFTGEFEVAIAPGCSFRVRSYGDVVENDLFWRGYGKGWEGPTLLVWQMLAARSSFIVDVGANSGIYALAAQAINRCARVMAVEPSRIAFERLQENITLNDFPIIAENVAASDENGPVTFYDFPGSHQYSASMVKGFRPGAVPIEVQAAKLDTLFEKYGFDVDLLKMDVEGHEPAALRGMKKTLEARRPTLILEILNDEAGAAIQKELKGLGYTTRRLGDANVLFSIPDR